MKCIRSIFVLAAVVLAGCSGSATMGKTAAASAHVASAAPVVGADQPTAVALVETTPQSGPEHDAGNRLDAQDLESLVSVEAAAPSATSTAPRTAPHSSVRLTASDLESLL